MQKILEINPLECPRCKSEMRIIAFLDDPTEISKITISLNIPTQINPEPAPLAPPTYDDLLYLNAFNGIDQIFNDLDDCLQLENLSFHHP